MREKTATSSLPEDKPWEKEDKTLYHRMKEILREVRTNLGNSES
jgi:hypothetical protein